MAWTPCSTSGPIRGAGTGCARLWCRQDVLRDHGTSTANKIVCPVLITPGDVVLVDYRNLSQVPSLALMLGGAQSPTWTPIRWMTTQVRCGPLGDHHSVPARLRGAGRLDQVKMLSLLTNCTFDGIVPTTSNGSCASALPSNRNLVFLWDEAWFAFAGFHPISGGERRCRRRAGFRDGTAAPSSQGVRRSRANHDLDHQNPMPDPDRVRIRAYATQSTHKTLTSLRQGRDPVLGPGLPPPERGGLRRAYMTHTLNLAQLPDSASLDVGPSPGELEGYQLVQRQAELAMNCSTRPRNHPQIRSTSVSRPARNDPARTANRDRAPAARRVLADGGGWQHDDSSVIPPPNPADRPLRHRRDTLQAQLPDGQVRPPRATRHPQQRVVLTNIGTTLARFAYLIEVLAKSEELDDDSPSSAHSAGEPRSRVAASPPTRRRFGSSRRSPTGPARSHSPDGDLRAAVLPWPTSRRVRVHPADELAARVEQGGSGLGRCSSRPTHPDSRSSPRPGRDHRHSCLQSALDTREIPWIPCRVRFSRFTEAALRGSGTRRARAESRLEPPPS